jgi:hypothetical protein
MYLRVRFPRPKRHQFAQKALERLLDSVTEPAPATERAPDPPPPDLPASAPDPELAEAIRMRLS